MENYGSPTPRGEVEDLTIEELAEVSGAATAGSAGTVGCASTPASIGSAATIGSK